MTPQAARRRFLGALAGAGATLGTATLARASGASPETLILPPGTRGPITLSLTRPVCIRGTGVDTSVIQGDLTLHGRYPVTISDLTIRGQLRIQNDEHQPVYLDRIAVRRDIGAPGAGIALINTTDASLSHCRVFGGEIGIWSHGTDVNTHAAFTPTARRCLITRVDHCVTRESGIGFLFDGNNEGIYISHCEAIGGHTGYRYMPAMQAPGTAIIGCHANTSLTGIHVERVAGLSIANCLVFRNSNNNLAVGIRLNRSWACSISGSKFFNIGGGNACFAVLADGEGGYDNQIVNNTIHGATFAGVGIIDGTRDCTVTGNRFRYTPAPYFERASRGNRWEEAVLR